MINEKIKQTLIHELDNSSIAILGFGREGRSSYKFLRQIFPEKQISIVDINTSLSNDIELVKDSNIEYVLGENYLKEAERFDVLFKSPGISFVNYSFRDSQLIFSQADIFLRFFGKQTIGVTGTKGKSTTVSLLKHILDGFYSNVLLIGNIGIPALDVVDKINDDTMVVFELSSHQLEYVHHSPHIAILLNLYQEHLDHYKDYKAYRMAKWNIAKFQSKTDFFIFSDDEHQVNEDIKIVDIKSNLLKYNLKNNELGFLNNETTFSYNELSNFGFENSKFKLVGKHNLNNLMASLLAIQSLHLPLDKAIEKAMDFKALPHRIEFVGEVKGVKFYNDSIATIPEATIRALESISDVQTVILGGFDRGIDYTKLITFLRKYRPLNLLLIGKVGTLLKEKLQDSYAGNIIEITNFGEVVDIAIKVSPQNSSCLLSPAASSYDSFKNFEERGDVFKNQVINKLKEC
jgi:UDP-N-acetylmuramoylalanine--D-glutamate ligase